MARWQGFYDELAADRYPALLAYATAFTGQRATAEDLVQEALVRTFASPRRLASAQHAEHYVRRAIATIFIDDRRREALFRRSQSRLAADETAPGPDVQVDERDAVTAALAGLAPQVRACVVLRYYDDLTIGQVAETLRLATGTVKRYLHDAGAVLRAHWGPTPTKNAFEWFRDPQRREGTDMPTLHELMAASIDGRTASYATGAPPLPDTVAGRISALRRRRTVAAGATSALAVGGLLAAGAMRGEARGAQDPASASSGSVAMATAVIDLNDIPTDGQGPGVHRAYTCGEDMGSEPDDASLDGFALTASLVGGNELRPGADDIAISTTVTYDGEPHAPVFLDTGFAVLAKDGKIVSEVGTSYISSLPFRQLDPGSSWTGAIMGGLGTASNLTPCAPNSVDGLRGMELTDVVYEAGDYEVYVIASATTSESLAAQAYLWRDRLVLASEQSGSWAPGSVDCEDEDRWVEDGMSVAQCHPDRVPGMVLDAANATASVPYPADTYQDDVSVRLISEPLHISIPQDLTWADLGFTQQMVDSINRPAPEPLDAAALACNARPYVGLTDEAPVSAYVTGRTTPEAVTAPGGVPVKVDPFSNMDTGWIEVGTPTEVWLVATGPTGAPVVVGSASASLSPGGRIEIDRLHGYPDVSLSVSNVRWCGEPAASLSAVVLVADVSVAPGPDPNSGALPDAEDYAALTISLFVG